ncbi:MAG: hypothetical protein ABI577_18830 [bacterium]
MTPPFATFRQTARGTLKVGLANIALWPAWSRMLSNNVIVIAVTVFVVLVVLGVISVRIV